MNHVTCIYMDQDGYCHLDGCSPCPFDDVFMCPTSDFKTTNFELETKTINDYDASSFDLPF